jgi:hypothetical protein
MLVLNFAQIVFIALLLIGFAFVFDAHPFKKKQRLVVGSNENQNLWTAGDYFTFVNSLIKASNSMEELQKVEPLIDGYFDKPFRVPISNADVKKYYARLLESYCEAEAKVQLTTGELCKN